MKHSIPTKTFTCLILSTLVDGGPVVIPIPKKGTASEKVSMKAETTKLPTELNTIHFTKETNYHLAGIETGADWNPELSDIKKTKTWHIT